VGTPAPTPFTPDHFQSKALELLKTSDVIVTAPTGTGKTWIAEQAILRILEAGKSAWYASPLKALSNSIFAHFQEMFDPENVGILTGDRKENFNAPVIVGTTEILRNQLYDAMHRGEDLRCDLVILDEAHYLGDIDRGVVWEEVLIYLPSHTKILMLSATIQNAQEIANWLTWHRNISCELVVETKRSVSLHPVFWFPSGEVCPLEKGGKLYKKIDLWLRKSKGKGSGGFKSLPPFGKIIGFLGELNLLPAIFFLKSRSDCNNALPLCGPSTHWATAEKKGTFREMLNEIFHEHPYLQDHPQLEFLTKYRVAAHHGGQLPRWKQLVEDLMKKNFLDAIFSTSTVAAGMNFPARTVVIVQSDRFNGTDFVDLTATDLTQMTGRAGRRGMDRIGFAVILPGPYQNVRFIQILFSSPPNPVESQIRVNFSMVLNLLPSYQKDDIQDLFKSSFATYQQLAKDKNKEKNLKKLDAIIDDYLSDAACSSRERVIKTRALYRNLQKKMDVTGKEISKREKALGEIQCHRCMFSRQCLSGKNNSIFNSTLRQASRLDEELRHNREFLWRDFLRHLEFLKKKRYVDQENRLTNEGVWASRLRVDQPLLLAHYICEGLLDDQTPALVAAMLAPFVNDRGKDIQISLHGFEDSMLKARFNRLMDSIKPLLKSLKSAGFPTPALSFWPMWTIYQWARGADWNELIGWLGLDEGDMAMLVFRTADHLRQVTDLKDVYPGLALCSYAAIDLIIREPILPD